MEGYTVETSNYRVVTDTHAHTQNGYLPNQNIQARGTANKQFLKDGLYVNEVLK